MPARIGILVAFDHFREGDGPVACGVRFDDAHDVAVGTRVSVGYEGPDHMRGERTIEALGAWPRSGIAVPGG